MTRQELCIHDYDPDDKLPIRPKGALIDKQAAISLVDQTRSPRFRSPGRIQLLLQEQRELIGIGHGDDPHVAAFVVRLHPMTLEPVAERRILSVAELRRSHSLPMEILRLLNSAVVPHDQRCAAAGRSCYHSQSLSVGTHVAVNCRVWTYVSHVNRATKQGFNGGGAGVEAGPLHFHLRSHGFVEPAVGFSHHGLRVRNIGKRAHANGSLRPPRKRGDQPNHQPKEKSLTHSSFPRRPWGGAPPFLSLFSWPPACPW